MKVKLFIIIATLIFTLSSCEYLIFPIHSEDSIPQLDLPTGTFEVEESELRLELNGRVRELTIISPSNESSEAEEWFIWSMGVNNRVYFHKQWFHSLASFGITVLVVQPKDISFLDFNHLGRIVDENISLLELMQNKKIEGRTFEETGSIGGFSVGGSVAAFIAAESNRFTKLLLWAPSPSPYWTGVNPDDLSGITAESLFLLGEYDNVTAPEEWPAELASYINSEKSTVLIPEGVHLYFMEPAAVDERNPETIQTRQSQYRFSVEKSIEFLLGSVNF